MNVQKIQKEEYISKVWFLGRRNEIKKTRHFYILGHNCFALSSIFWLDLLKMIENSPTSVLNENKSEHKSASSSKKQKHENNGNVKKSISDQPTVAVKAANSAVSAMTTKINSKMLEAFWKLSEYNAHIRLEGINQLVRYFGTLDVKLNQESYNYVLVRLIRGLASNRKCSRLGFSCCLTELLNSYETLKFEFVLELGKKHLNYSGTVAKEEGAPVAKKKQANETLFTKEEIRHMQIGLAFVYLCWIQSNRFQKVRLCLF